MVGLGTLQLATVEWLKFPEERLSTQHLQFDSNCKVKKQNRNRRYVGHDRGRDWFMSKWMSNYYLLWRTEKRQCWKLFCRRSHHWQTVNPFSSYHSFLHVYALCLWWCNLQEPTTKTKHSPVSRTIAADFTSCRTKPSSLLICFLQFLPQTVRSYTPQVDTCNPLNHMVSVSAVQKH